MADVKVKLSFQDGSGYKKCIGKYQGKDGRVRPKIFWLGAERGLAEQKALALLRKWEQIIASGGNCWTDDSIREVLGSIISPAAIATPVSESNPVRESPVQPAPKGPDQRDESLMLHSGVDLYVAHVEAQAPHQLAQSHAARTRQLLESFKTVFPNRPLSSVNYDYLVQVVNYYASRPQTKRKTKMAVETVLRFISYVRSCFLWLEDSGRLELPRRFERLFRVKRSKLLTPAERQQQGAEIETFTTDELERLYEKANSRQRMYLLMGLFTLSTQRELSVMLKSEFDLVKGELRHYRNKTGVLGVFWLPPELVSILNSELSKTPTTVEGVAFLTEDGNPLVHYSSNANHIDSVKMSWRRLCKKAKVSKPFKLLRKHAAKMIRHIAGTDVAAWALSHSERNSVTTKHYANNRDFDKVIAAQKEMHRQLATMFRSALNASGPKAMTSAHQTSVAA